MLYGVELHNGRLHRTHHNYQHQHPLNQSRGKENKNMKTNNTKTLVDSNNTLWTMDYDMYDNSVTVVSDKSNTGDYAVVSQYSMDNALGHDIPENIINSALDMVSHDAPRQSTLDYIIDSIAESSEQGLV